MNISFHGMCGCFGAMLMCAMLTAAHAADGVVADPVEEQRAYNVRTAPSDAGPPTFFATGAPIDSERLAGMRGGTDVVTSDQALRGTVGSNMAADVVSGANSISAGSFASASGIPIVIQNSGANVLIQNATVINLQMH